MVLIDIACGTPPSPRTQTLHDIGQLKNSHQASLEEIYDFIEREKLFGLGCGLVDMAILASTLITPDASLWTLDKDLANLAHRFGVCYQSNLH